MRSSGWRLRAVGFARRLGAFVLLFSAVPVVAGLAVTAKYSGMRPLALSIVNVAPGFAVRVVAAAALASVVVAAVLALASCWAWRDEDGAHLVRAARLVGAMALVAVVLYPGFASWLPALRSMPWWSVVAVTGGLTAALHALPGACPSWREPALAAAACAAFFANPAPGPVDLAAVAGRRLDRRDVLLLGFDSVSYGDTAQLLRQVEPRHGTKLVYSNAWTPVIGTSSAWRSIFSGEYPVERDVLPGAIWPPHHAEWLPRELSERGYQTVMMQDGPETNTYGKDEWVHVPSRQGWKAIFEVVAWRIVFPLSETGGHWWVAALGGPADSVSRYAYRPEWFRHDALLELARQARRGPVLWASHTCYMHAPLHLSLREAMRLERWWARTPRSMEGSGNVFTDEASGGDARVAAVRLASLREELARWLGDLDAQGVLGKALVVILSDHGQRAPWVSDEEREHVQLALFTPSEGRGALIGAPVSLVDLAPTVRRWLGLPAVATAGAPLPLERPARPGPRAVGHVAVWTLDSMGIHLGDLTRADVERALEFNDDGTYAFQPGVLDRVGHVVQFVEHWPRPPDR
jgi:hypothetical protein